jgi:DNA-directed RNA polymerase subunit RPC12/RpoP
VAISFECSSCKASLKVKDELAGRKGKCPRCGNVVSVPTVENIKDSEAEKRPYGRPASSRQKEFASSLGVEFPDDIRSHEISKLIDEALVKQDEERYQALEDISRREGEAYDKLREEILCEIDEDELDCRLSTATTEEMIDELSRRGDTTILISFDLDEYGDFDIHKLKQVAFEIIGTDDLDEEVMRRVLEVVSVMAFQRNPKRNA